MIQIGIKDVLDIVLVGTLLYYLYTLMRRSRSANLFKGIIFFIMVWIIVSYVLEMRLLGGILDRVVNVGALALVVLFQEEIRHFFSTIGAHQQTGRLMSIFRTIVGHPIKHDAESSHDEIMAIVMACVSMGRQKIGALIIVEEEQRLTDEVATGEIIDAHISQRLIENIFFKNSPLHDGALIISSKRLKAAGCILPVSHDHDIPKSLGLRHRAALGISQKTDSLAIIVSEETGSISVAHRGMFHLHLNAEDLEQHLRKAFESQVS